MYWGWDLAGRRVPTIFLNINVAEYRYQALVWAKRFGVLIVYSFAGVQKLGWSYKGEREVQYFWTPLSTANYPHPTLHTSNWHERWCCPLYVTIILYQKYTDLGNQGWHNGNQCTLNSGVLGLIDSWTRHHTWVEFVFLWILRISMSNKLNSCMFDCQKSNLRPQTYTLNYTEARDMLPNMPPN